MVLLDASRSILEVLDCFPLKVLIGRSRYAQKNPAGGTPYLEFEDGTVISETVTICELLDCAYHPGSGLSVPP